MDDASLLAAIAARPDDDAPRLVYADALLERGDPRGELIQVQCALAKLDEDDARRKALAAREAALLEAHGGAWTASPVGDVRLALERGMVERAIGEPDVLAANAALLIRALPTLRSFELDLRSYGLDQAEALDAFVRSPAMDVARSLTISSPIARRRTPLAPFLAAAANVQALSFDGAGLMRDDFDALVAAPCLAHLRVLCFSNARLGKNASAPLARATFPLERFVFPSFHAGPALGEALAAAPAFAQLRELVVPGNEIGAKALDAIVRAKRLSTVETLDLRSNALDAKSVAGLFDDRVLPRVRKLFLGGNAIGDDTARAIARWPGASRLEKLHLGSTKLGDRGALALARSPHLATLRSLVLSFVKLKAATKDALVASPTLARARIYVGNAFLARAAR